MANNKIKSLESVLSFVAKMTNLTKLDLGGNEVCSSEEYREKVMAALKKHSVD
jgi:Leucine-rich repeat (LRR) protein